MKKEEVMNKIIIPNGSLGQPTFELLAKVGVNVVIDGRNGEARVTGTPLFDKAILMRPQNIPRAFVCGDAVCAIVGWDCVIEDNPALMDVDSASSISPFVVVTKMEYAKSSLKPVYIVLFRREDSVGISTEIERRRIITEYPNITRRRFPHADILFSHGSTEIQIKEGMADLGVCPTETGRTIHDNGLVIVETLLKSPVVFIARQLTPEIEVFGQMLSGALEAESLQLLKMNVAEEDKQRVANLLPALKAPTVSQLADGSFALETVAHKTNLVGLLIKLRQAGATGILVQDINTVLY